MNEKLSKTQVIVVSTLSGSSRSIKDHHCNTMANTVDKSKNNQFNNDPEEVTDMDRAPASSVRLERLICMHATSRFRIWNANKGKLGNQSYP